MLYVPNAGTLDVAQKVRGRKAALRAIRDGILHDFSECDPTGTEIHILQADCVADAEWVRDEIRKAREITDKPLGMNIMLLSPNADDLAQLAIDEKIEVLTTGAGNPGKYIADWKNAGIKVMPVVASVALAKRMERAGAESKCR